jgi:hypothetical protein
MISLRLIVASLSISIAIGVNAATSFDTFVGEKKLALPVPAGFTEPSSEAPALRTLAARFIPPQMRLLAVYIADSDVAAVKEGREAALRRYFMVAVLRDTESEILEPEEFQEVKTQLRGAGQAAYDRAQVNAREQLKSAARDIGIESGLPDFKLEIGRTQQLGFFDETKSSISMLDIVPGSAKGGTLEFNSQVGVATSVVLVEGKVVSLAAYSTLDSNEDYKWLRQQSASWIRATTQATSK